ncbi:MAG TPA: S8 family serine peptidase [Anaerolineae bacterium]|nr:S8 family serine peptidase [Anaerolineae bacterium]
MKRKTLPLIALIVVTLLLTSGLSLAAPAAQEVNWQSKVDPWVLDTARADGQTEFLVFLADQADLSAAAGLSTKLEKGTFVYETLSRKAAETQGPVLDALKARGVEHRAYWVANMIWVRGGLDTVEAMARRADVAHLYANPTVHFDGPVEMTASAPESPDAPEWNILKVNADDVWAAGYTGQGAVIGGQDTGYQWDHPALKGKYRGWNGSSADHNYSWHDSIHSGGGVCGPDSLVPCDDHGHGTHTVGTMVGDDGGANQIGMAPGAKWIGCRNMDQGNGTPTTYSECYQWFIAPTDLAGNNPNPAMAPDVISNSWGCPPSEGCTDPNVMLSVTNAVRAAGILSAHSAGNSGSACSTISDPSAIYDSAYTVGSTTNADVMSSFSSRGPVTIDGSNRLKPDISAPGSNIRSSYPGSAYVAMSGTSMASPHVAGLVALLVSVRPDWAGNVDQLENTINATAVQLTFSQTCGGIPGSQFPNNTIGYGRIDAYAAYQAAVIPTAVGLSVFSGSPAALPVNALPLLALPAATGLALAGAYAASRRRRG